MDCLLIFVVNLLMISGVVISDMLTDNMKYVGCFGYRNEHDINRNMELSNPSRNPTLRYCVGYCLLWGPISYVGIQRSQDSCFCKDISEVTNTLDDSMCNDMCLDLSNETCGGDFAISLYKTRTTDEDSGTIQDPSSRDDSISEQVNKTKSETKEENPKQQPNLEIYSKDLTTAPVTQKTEINMTNYAFKNETEEHLKDKPLSSSINATNSVEEDLDAGSADEEAVTLLRAVTVKLLVAQQHSIETMDLSLNQHSSFLEREDFNVYSVDFHWNKSLAFLAANNLIYRVNYMDRHDVSSLIEIVSERLDETVSLAVDWVHDKLYWICHKYQSIEMADLDGKNRRLLADNIRPLKFPNNIVVDPFEKVLFFVSNFTLFKATLDGSKIWHVPVNQNEPGNPGWGIKNIALDRVNKKIFTTGKTPSDSSTNYRKTVFISKINYDGTVDEKNLLEESRFWNDFYSMEVFLDNLYFANFLSSNPDKLYELSLTTKRATPQLKFVPDSEENGIWSLRVFHPCVQLFPSSQGQCSK